MCDEQELRVHATGSVTAIYRGAVSVARYQHREQQHVSAVLAKDNANAVLPSCALWFQN